MAIDGAMPIAAEQLAEGVCHNNVMGICCFGEQGMNHRRQPTHGNLMFGCLLFSNKAGEHAVAQPFSSSSFSSSSVPWRRRRGYG